MTSSEIRNSFLKFFEGHGHAIVPSSPVVPYDDPTLLFANAGMNQFKDVFLGSGKRSYTRAVNTQKCIRVSGKHNDLEEVGRDTYHHTFFEMLGNWSFGDYYKKEAIAWGWDLLTNVWGLPKNRLWATVYKDDDEAEQLWKTVTDIDHSHILRFDEKDNFWEMGETGPCGPCSEIHVDRTPDGTATAAMVNAGVAEVMEIWNLVFIQYNRDASGKLTPLPAKHVDTGMGFERMCAVLQNKSSNYDTDVFTPLINRISELTAKPYDGRMSSISQQQMEIDTAMRVIADHIRTLTFAIGDGAVPSNEGRGYVLRRLLRRAARFGRNLDMREPFVYKLVPTLVNTMGTVFPEIIVKSEQIQKIIKGEEEGFNATLDRGLEIFEEVVKKVISNKYQVISGEDVFKLYDTYGFPVDLTALLAQECDLKIDEQGFSALMEEQRERSRGGAASQIHAETSISAKEILLPGKDVLQAFVKDITTGNLKFVGYDELETTATLVKGGRHLLVLDATPFYGEAGGQVGDKGIIEIDNQAYNVYDTQKVDNLNVHILEEPTPAMLGEKVRAKVNVERRLSIMRNHTATHLVHAALRKILGTHVHQSGSLVAPDHLRFDFAHFSKVSEQELADIEALVNDKIKENITLNHHRNIPFEEAKKMGALMFFGDKYGDRVNVVEFSEFSKEFCGGTHVKSTGDIGYFKFRSEGSVASGIRRIEAVTSDGALELLKLQDRNLFERIDYALEQLHQISELSNELYSINGNKASLPQESLQTFGERIEGLKSLPKHSDIVFKELKTQFNERSQRALQIENIILELAEKKRSIEKELSKYRLQSLSGDIEGLVQKAVSLNGAKLVSAKVSAGSMDELKSLGDTLRAKLGSGVGLLASVIDEKVALVCTVSDDLIRTKNVQAGKIVGAVAKLVGGAGGGKPHLATAGGKDVAKLDEALRSTEAIVKSFLNN